MYLFVDTETSGRSPATGRAVQIAWILTDRVGRIVCQSSQIIRPDGFEIDPGAIRIHGITKEKAMKFGVPLEKALAEFMGALAQADVLIGHNIQFDISILQNDMRAARMGRSLMDFPKICTMRASTSWCRITKLDGKNGFKWPTLSELHWRCFGKNFEGAHDALSDIQATMRCFFHLVEKDVIAPPAARIKPGRPSVDDSKAHIRQQPGPRVSEQRVSESASRKIGGEKTLFSRHAQVSGPTEGHEREQNVDKRSSIRVPSPAPGFTSTQEVKADCGKCKHLFTVVLTRYESTGYCPACHTLNRFPIKW